MSVGNIQFEQPYISCFDWKAKQDDRRREVIFTADNASHYISGDTPSLLRIKFGCLFIYSLAMIPAIRLPSRCIFLLTGSWAFVGCEKANKIWMQECVRCAAESLTPPHPLIYYRIVAISILSELIQDIVKCVTLPLALIGIACAIMWGMFNPYDGRKLIGGIEDLWSIELPAWAKYQTVEAWANYLAVCMQDIETFKKHNFFRYYPGYYSHSLRSLLLSLTTLHKEGLSHIENFEERIPLWTNKVKKESPKDELETNPDGTSSPNPKQDPIREALVLLLRASNEVNQLIVNAAKPEAAINATLQDTINEKKELINKTAALLDQICKEP